MSEGYYFPAYPFSVPITHYDTIKELLGRKKMDRGNENVTFNDMDESILRHYKNHHDVKIASEDLIYEKLKSHEEKYHAGMVHNYKMEMEQMIGLLKRVRNLEDLIDKRDVKVDPIVTEKDYRILTGNDQFDLERKVCNMLEEGYVTRGGVAIIEDVHDNTYFYQAVVKDLS